MRHNKSFFSAVIIAFFFSLLLTGCGTKNLETPETSGLTTGPGTAGSEESLDTDPSMSTIMEGRTSGPMLPIYFDFDSSSIRGDQVERAEKNADFLKSKADVNIRIEGNCDPRGTNEYNLALGERRAQSARKYLVNLGIDDARISTVSWGEEKLLLHGHDELSWAQNRRDDFVIVK